MKPSSLSCFKENVVGQSIDESQISCMEIAADVLDQGQTYYIFIVLLSPCMILAVMMFGGIVQWELRAALLSSDDTHLELSQA